MDTGEGPGWRRDIAPLLMVCCLGGELKFQRLQQIKFNLRKKASHQLLVKTSARQFSITYKILNAHTFGQSNSTSENLSHSLKTEEKRQLYFLVEK